MSNAYPLAATGGASVDTIQAITATGNVTAWGSLAVVTSATATTQTLPTATAGNIGKTIKVKNMGAGAVTVAPFGAEAIAGQVVIPQFESVTYEVSAAGVVHVVSNQNTSPAPTVTTTYTQTAHGFTVGQWVRHNGTIFALTDPSSAAGAEAPLYVSAVTTNSFTVSKGFITGTGFVAGDTYFLSTTLGAITSVAPVSGFLRAVLRATSTTEAYTLEQATVNLTGSSSTAAVVTLQRAGLAVTGANVAIGTVATTVGSGYVVLPLSNAAFNQVYDPYGLVVGNTITIKQSGDYRFNFTAQKNAWPLTEVYAIRKNGVIVSGRANAMATEYTHVGMDVILPLVAGDKLEISQSATDQYVNPTITIDQLPTAATVQVSALPTYAYVRRSGSTSGTNFTTITGTTSGAQDTLAPIGQRVPFTSANSTQAGITVGTNTFTIPTDGYYEIVSVISGDANSTAGFHWQQITNGTLVLATGMSLTSGTNATSHTAVFSGLLTTGTVIDVRVNNTSSTVTGLGNVQISVKAIK
jgi:hypothetical protein